MAYPPEDRPVAAPEDGAPPPLPPELAGTLAGLEGAGKAPPPRRPDTAVPRTRTSAVWFGVWAGAVALILLIIFVAQNTGNVRLSFLWMDGQISLALAMLIAGVCGAFVAMAVASVRIIQLRRLVRRR
ncbi:lipopolysaccharide assembly protein LapA domain-containing protein [Actinoplanes sp. NPDC049118]|uniref:LapA family protein n=1 Tax=Actinoplanes sp. NPDC049118 TaxID=3155769 RepID=UPI0033F6010C